MISKKQPFQQQIKKGNIMTINPLTNKLLHLDGYEDTKVYFNCYVHKDQFNEMLFTGYWSLNACDDGCDLLSLLPIFLFRRLLPCISRVSPYH